MDILEKNLETPETPETSQISQILQEEHNLIDPLFLAPRHRELFSTKKQCISGFSGSGKSLIAEIFLNLHESFLQENLDEHFRRSRQEGEPENGMQRILDWNPPLHLRVVPKDPKQEIPQEIIDSLVSGKLPAGNFWRMLITCALNREEIPAFPEQGHFQIPRDLEPGLVFDGMDRIPVSPPRQIALLQTLGEILQEIENPIRLFLLPSWKGWMPKRDTFTLHWPLEAQRGLWLFHLHEDGPDLSPGLFRAGDEQSEAVDSFLDLDSERGLMQFLKDCHGDLSPASLIEGVDRVSRESGAFTGYDDPQAILLADFHRKSLLRRHPEALALLEALPKGVREPVRWSKFVQKRPVLLPDLENALNRVQRLMEIGVICRRNPKEEMDGREYLVAPAIRKTYGLNRMTDHQDGDNHYIRMRSWRNEPPNQKSYRKPRAPAQSSERRGRLPRNWR